MRAGASSKYAAELMKRFSGREDLGRERAYDLYWSQCDKSEVLALFDCIEQELGIPVGVLRPTDSVDLLFEPVRSANPFKWLVNKVRSGDTHAELVSQVWGRLKKYGTTKEWTRIATVNELVRAWCGEPRSTLG